MSSDISNIDYGDLFHLKLRQKLAKCRICLSKIARALHKTGGRLVNFGHTWLFKGSYESSLNILANFEWTDSKIIPPS